MRTILTLSAALLLMGPVVSQDRGGDDFQAGQILDQALAQYRGIQTFYARVRQVDTFYNTWMVIREERRWEELRARPNKLRLLTIFPQEEELPEAVRLLGEEPPVVDPPKDGPLPYSLVACDGTSNWHEMYGLIAFEAPVGQGQTDTENMAAAAPSELFRLEKLEDWPDDPPADAPITIAELMDGKGVRDRIQPGTLQLVTHKDENNRDTAIEDVVVLQEPGAVYRSCHHIVFLLTNGLEQHYWIDTESSMVVGEMVVRVLPPEKDPFLDPEPAVELPTGLSDLAMHRLNRVRRYMTGSFVRTLLFYDYLRWNFEPQEGIFTYKPSDAVSVVGARELYPALQRLYELTTGKKVPKEPPAPSANVKGDEPLIR